jgi:hypothetical protein
LVTSEISKIRDFSINGNEDRIYTKNLPEMEKLLFLVSTDDLK